MNDDEPAGDGSDGLGDAERYYRGVITRVYYGSESGVLRSDSSGREYRFKRPFVEVRGSIPRISGLREGMTVGFDLARTSHGVTVSVIRTYE